MAVKVVGYRAAMRALRDMPEDLRKATRLEINRAANEAVKLARGYAPDDPGMRGWDKANYSSGSRWYDRAWSGPEVRRGIRVYRGRDDRNSYRGWVNAIGIENRSAAGMIYELAGSKSNGRDERGRRFIDNIASTGLRKPLRRVVVRAGVEIGPKVTRRILAALKAVERRTNRWTA